MSLVLWLLIIPVELAMGHLASDEARLLSARDNGCLFLLAEHHHQTQKKNFFYKTVECFDSKHGEGDREGNSHSVCHKDSSPRSPIEHRTRENQIKGLCLNLSPFFCSLLDHSAAHDFHLQTVKRCVTFSVANFDIKPQIIICGKAFFKFFITNIHPTMKITTTKGVGVNTKKPLFPLVLESSEILCKWIS